MSRCTNIGRYLGRLLCCVEWPSLNRMVKRIQYCYTSEPASKIITELILQAVVKWKAAFPALYCCRLAGFAMFCFMCVKLIAWWKIISLIGSFVNNQGGLKGGLVFTNMSQNHSVRRGFVSLYIAIINTSYIFIVTSLRLEIHNVF